MTRYYFYKEENKWYIDLPDYIDMGGSQCELEMVSGADDFLDLLSGNGENVSLNISEAEFPDCNKLVLTERAENIMGGAWYQTEGQVMWLCSVTLFVFEGKYPDVIYYSTYKKQ